MSSASDSLGGWPGPRRGSSSSSTVTYSAVTRSSRQACTRPPRRSTLQRQRQLSAASSQLSRLVTLNPIRHQSSRGAGGPGAPPVEIVEPVGAWRAGACRLIGVVGDRSSGQRTGRRLPVGATRFLGASPARPVPTSAGHPALQVGGPVASSVALGGRHPAVGAGVAEEPGDRLEVGALHVRVDRGRPVDGGVTKLLGRGPALADLTQQLPNGGRVVRSDRRPHQHPPAPPLGASRLRRVRTYVQSTGPRSQARWRNLWTVSTTAARSAAAAPTPVKTRRRSSHDHRAREATGRPSGVAWTLARPAAASAPGTVGRWRSTAVGGRASSAATLAGAT